MTVSILDFTMTAGPHPAVSDVSRVALEAAVSDTDASLAISAAWHVAEGFTGRTYREVSSATLIVSAGGPGVVRWPRYPWPDAVEAEWHDGQAWVPGRSLIVGGLCEIEHAGKWKLTASDVPAAPIGDHVTQGVVQVALYNLIWAPQRREFSHQSAGDTSLTREAQKGILYGSGAGALLASEVVL